MKLAPSCALAALLFAFGAPLAEAHATSTNHLEIVTHDARAGAGADLAIRWDLALADVQWSIDLDSNGDRRVTWAEVLEHRPAIEALAESSLELQRGNAACELARGAAPRLTHHVGEPYVALSFIARCGAQGALRVRSQLFFGVDAMQRTLLVVTGPSGESTAMLSPGAPFWQESAHPSAWRSFVSFIWQGMIHVWSGYDHLAFLLLLLLPSVLAPLRDGTGWRAAGNARKVAGDLARIVTAFTLSHSITLALAATGTLRLPPAPIEAAIAVSIVAAGLLNLFPAFTRWRLGLAFGFGFVHGFGFANALQEIGTGGASLLPVLAGFNLGVEFAQLSLVALTLPLLLHLARTTLYTARLMPALSLATAMLGACWLAQRPI